MRILVGFIMLLAVAFTGCSSEDGSAASSVAEQSDQATRHAHILELTSKLTDETTLQTDSLVAVELLEKSVAYANDFPKDTATASILWLGQGAARGLENYEMALVITDRIISDYPAFEKMPHCLYLKAYLLDFYLDLPDDARKAYQALIHTYPDYTSAPQARERLQYIGLSDAELMRRLEEKNNAALDTGAVTEI